MAIDPRDRNLHPREPARADTLRADAARADASHAEAAARAEAARARAAQAEAARDHLHARPAPEYRPRRRRWPGVLAAALIGAAIAGLMVSNYYSDRTVGERLDSVVDKAGQSAQQGAREFKQGAAAAADEGAQAGVQVSGTVAQKVDDAAITAKVKTALAVDPALSALKIDVTTRDGIVALEGPAPDAQARERAAVLAAAPEGVVRVDNRLVVEPPAN